MYPTVQVGVCVRGEGREPPGVGALTKLVCLSRGMSWSPGAYGGGGSWDELWQIFQLDNIVNM